MYLPAIYASPFKCTNVEVIKQLCFSSYLYYLSIIFSDKVLDNQVVNSLEMKNHILLSQSLQSYAIQSLQNIFERGSKFWEFFNLRNSEWLDSVYNENEQDFDITITNYTKHVISKVCIGKLSIDAIYVIENQKNKVLHQRFIDLYEMFYVSYQILDDIDDFEEDYDNNQINIAKDKTLKLINSRQLNITSKKEIKSIFY
ncbi:hypothetical protein V8G61_01075 [Gaetbulibacter sp. M240]|uniref:hypothetical protein n=1 Tax=Gaetbulibacter sp. M240 TaxID=3126511 RepID=UPI00374EBD72